ncbi:MAG: hypothetical protein JWR23_745 [Mucilaginibacter sp.]|nr:hypothetical protein [Mucilaginibacter sp.]
MSIPHLIKFIVIGDFVNWGLILFVDLLLIAMFVYLFVKYFIPAFQNKIALEINSEEIISYIKDVSIKWSDVKEVTTVSGRYSSSLYIKFKYETDHGDSIRIGLQYIKGDNEKIYDTAILYFEQSN